MNKNRFLIAFLAMVALFFAGCDSNNEEKIEQDDTGDKEDFVCKLLNNQDIDRMGGTFYWAVKANGAWKLDANRLPDWFTIEPSEGKAGTTGVVLNVEELTDDQVRSIELPFVSGEKEVKIMVRQTLEGGEEEGDGPVCRFVGNEVFEKGGGSLTYILETSADWSLSKDADWLTVSQMQGGAGRTELSLTAEPTEILRVALLTFTLEGRTEELVVCQNLKVSGELISPDFYWFEKNPPIFKGYVEQSKDEVQPSECGFAYKEKGDDTWTCVPIDVEIDDNGDYWGYFLMGNINLENGKSYRVRVYAKLNGTVFFSEEEAEIN